LSKQTPHKQPDASLKNGHLLSREALILLMQAVHAKGRLFRFNVGGHSMAPFIRDGDTVTLSPLSTRPPSPGDVVAFLHPETKGLCLHRVVSVHQGLCLLQGDNLPTEPDGFIPQEAIFGKVAGVERGGRQIRLGLGPERRLIAYLSRHGLLELLRRHAGPLYAYLQRRHRLCTKDL
jgi:hypothetical protein